MKKVLVIPGDGIGPEVILPCIDILSNLDEDIDFRIESAGKQRFEITGESIAEETIDFAKEADAILFGATESCRDNEYRSPVLRLRKELALFACVRPVRSIKTGSREIDMTIIRESTEGLYTQDEERDGDGVTTRRRVTERGCRRIVDFAFEWCEKHSRERLTCVHKANVLKISDGLFLDIFNDISNDHPEIEADDILVDAAASKMVMSPSRFDTIVTLNLYGDVLSDLAAGLVGGLGFVPSANIGKDRAMFEPSHGAAPDIAGKGIANPYAALLSAGMMLEYIGHYDVATKLGNAIEKALKEDLEFIDDEGRCDTGAVFQSVRRWSKESSAERSSILPLISRQ